MSARRWRDVRASLEPDETAVTQERDRLRRGKVGTILRDAHTGEFELWYCSRPVVRSRIRGRVATWATEHGYTIVNPEPEDPT